MYAWILRIVDRLSGIEFRHETRRTVPDTCWRHPYVEYFDRCASCDAEAELWLEEAVANEYIEADRQRDSYD